MTPPPLQEFVDALHAKSLEAETLAEQTGLPATNAQGDPLTLCRNHTDRAIYAVAALGADRDLCADCRPAQPDPAPHGEPVSVIDQAGAPASGEVTRAQIGAGVLMACGARDFAKDDKNGLLMFRVGPQRGKVLRKVLVRLMPDDTYTVEYGRTTTNPLSPAFGEWFVIDQETGIYAEQLAATVRRLGDRERY